MPVIETWIVRWVLATLHLLALAIGFGAIWARGRGLRGRLDAAGLKQVLRADSWWGIAALVWIATGVARVFGPYEKGTSYYFHNWMFLSKMGLLLLIILLEIWPTVALIGWRMVLRRGYVLNPRHVLAFARISMLQTLLLVLMVVAAAAMARGIGGF
jgi:putative membrane protein